MHALYMSTIKHYWSILNEDEAGLELGEHTNESAAVGSDSEDDSSSIEISLGSRAMVEVPVLDDDSSSIEFFFADNVGGSYMSTSRRYDTPKIFGDIDESSTDEKKIIRENKLVEIFVEKEKEEADQD